MDCRDATCEIEKQLHGDISPFQKIRLKAHLFLCKWCHKYYAKAQRIHVGISKLVNAMSDKKYNNSLNMNRFKAEFEKRIKNNPS